MGEVDIVGNDRAINKKTKCCKCNFTINTEPRGPEVVVINRKRGYTDSGGNL